MMRKFKTLGLAMVAVLAMSAVVASAAQAQWTANSYPTTYTATSALGNDDFKTEAGSVECEGHFEGTLTEAGTWATVHPHYTGCKAFGFASATVSMNECDYDIDATDGSVKITCPVGKKIVITAGACEVQIGEQSGLSSVDRTNNGNNVNIQATVTGIAYTVTKDGFLCPFNGTGAKTGATYTQNKAVEVKPVSGGTDLTVD